MKENNDDENLNDIINKIININSNIENNKITIKDIEDELFNIKRKIYKIEKKVAKIKMNEKDNIQEDQKKDNNNANNKLIQNIIGNNLNIFPPSICMNKIYKWEKCNNCYVLNECFDSKENKI